MKDKHQAMQNVVGRSLLWRIIIMLLMITMIQTACQPAATTTEAPTAAETPTFNIKEQILCKFSQEENNNYMVWFQKNEGSSADIICKENKGIVVDISTTAQDLQVFELQQWNTSEEIKSDFVFNRKVINFEVLNNTGQIMTGFNPPIRLYLAFTQDDLSIAKNNNSSLAFAYFNDKRTWVKFNPLNNDYTLLRSNDNGTTFQYWDGTNLQQEGDNYIIGKDLVNIKHLSFVYGLLRTFPNFVGFAYLHVLTWGDRQIGAGY